MALPASGPLSFSQINTEFGLGTAMSAYRGATYYIGSTSGTFPSTNLTFNNFYSTAPTSATSGVFLFSNGSTPFFSAYQWSSSGFGSKLSDPSSLPPGGVSELAVNAPGLQLTLGVPRVLGASTQTHPRCRAELKMGWRFLRISSPLGLL
jgi:hypothetical protein